MKIDLRGWSRRVRNYTVINRNLLSHGYHSPKVEKGRYHRGYPKGIAYKQLDNERFELTFQSGLGPSEYSSYRYSVEFNINELLPFIKPLLATKTLSELGLASSDLIEDFAPLNKGEMYSQYDLWDVFNEDYSTPDKKNYFPKYSKSKDGEYLIVFLKFDDLRYLPFNNRWFKYSWNKGSYSDGSIYNSFDVYDVKTGLIQWWGNKKTHSKQSLFQDVINNKLEVYFFTDWNTDEEARYLGQGKFMHFNDKLDDSILMVHQII